jgi:hypothetical protein
VGFTLFSGVHGPSVDVHGLEKPVRLRHGLGGVNKDTMGKHLVIHGYTLGYHQWIHHGEADRIREEAVRPRLEAFDDDAGVADMLDDAHQAHFAKGHDKQEMEANAKAFYKMLDSAQKPLHERTHVS